MEYFVSKLLLRILTISTTFSIFEMAFIQKIKMFPFFIRKHHIMYFNLFSSFLFGIPFAIFFYGLSFYNSLWVSFFGFIGAPSIYEALKKQNFINYTPKSSNCKN